MEICLLGYGLMSTVFNCIPYWSRLEEQGYAVSCSLVVALYVCEVIMLYAITVSMHE
jgi:hypothetical protein